MNNDLISSFTAPLSGDSPCGENLEYDPRMIELDEQYAGEPEHMMGDAVIPATPPDWRKLEKAAAGLMKETRDLRLAVIWTIARLANRGLSGLHEGLELIRELSENLWETLWPVPDDGDVQERLSTLMRLSPTPGSFDADTTVLRLLLATALTASPALGSYSLDDIRQAPEGSDAERTIRAALQNTPGDRTEDQKQDLSASIDLLRSIRDIYAGHGMGTPDFTLIGDLLKEMLLFLNSVAPAAAAAGAAAAEPSASAPRTEQSAASPQGSPQPPSGGEIGAPSAAAPAPAAALAPLSAFPAAIPPTGQARAGRQEAIRLMEQLCLWFEDNEPSSPVPYLLRRAIRLVGANIVDILAEIAPAAQDQLNNVLKPTRTPAAAAPAEVAVGSPVRMPEPQQAATPPSSPEADEYFSPFG